MNLLQKLLGNRKPRFREFLDPLFVFSAPVGWCEPEPRLKKQKDAKKLPEKKLSVFSCGSLPVQLNSRKARHTWYW
jgi:hypothetical protein